VRRLIPAAVAATVVVVGAAVVLAGCGGDDGPAATNATGLETRTVAVGEIDIRVEPRRLDDQGAVFAVSLDTHSVELSADLTEATLQVGGVTWPVGGWSGDGPGGHHRDGQLSFEPAGPASGGARLALVGFPEPVDVSWELEG
jgi:hypothetical protein